jgi:citrate lyase synthetase
MTLEEGLELIENYKKGLKKFLETLPEQSVQIGSEMIKTLTMNAKNEIANLEAIEKALKRSSKYESGLNS